MRVNRYSGSGLIQSAEIASTNTAPFGSVRVIYKSSGVPGVVEGNFFYSASIRLDQRYLLSRISFRG